METEENPSPKKKESEKNSSKSSSSQEESSKISLEKNPISITKKDLNPPTQTVPTKNQDLTSADIEPFLNLALTELKLNRDKLEKELKELSTQKSKVENELKSSFSGQSDAIARKVKGFQEYLTGALQDLTQSAEQLDLVVPPVIVTPSPLDENQKTDIPQEKEVVTAISDTFKPDEKLIRDCFNQFSKQPDFYAEPWQLRRSLETKDIEILEDWFFNMGGRGAQPSRGNRSRNVLISAALIAILGELYGDRFQALVLASQPERLGEWRRGLQDSLGLNREDFGPNSGVVLFERSGPLIERADRLEAGNEVPLILIDSAENNATNSEINKLVNQKLRKEFRPEFLNRIDEKIIFNNLGITELSQIAT